MQYYTTHPIILKFWEVAQYIPRVFPGILLFILSIFLSFMHYYTIRLIAVKFLEIVEYSLTKAPGTFLSHLSFVFYALLHHTSDLHEILESSLVPSHKGSWHIASYLIFCIYKNECTFVLNTILHHIFNRCKILESC